MTNPNGMPRRVYNWIKYNSIYIILLTLFVIMGFILHIELMRSIDPVVSWISATIEWLSSRYNLVALGSIAAILILLKMREPDGLFIRPYFIAFKVAKFGGKVFRWLRNGLPLIRLALVAVIVTLIAIVLEVSIGGLHSGVGLNETQPNADSKNASVPGLLQANTLIPDVRLYYQNEAILVQVFPDATGIAPKGYSNNTIYELPLLLRATGFFVERLFSQWEIILILWLFWELFRMARLRRKRIVIEDFKDHRNYKTDNAVVKGLSELLTTHLADISNLYTEINEMTSIQTTTGAGDPISATTLNAGDLSEVAKNPLTTGSKINFGLFEIPIGVLLSLIDSIFQGPKIIGCLQCILNENDEEEIVISAQMERGQHYSWSVSRKLPISSYAEDICVFKNKKNNDHLGQPVSEEGPSEKKGKNDAELDDNANINAVGKLCEEMVSELAYRIFTDIQFNVSGRELIRWKATRKFSEGLRAYRDHLRIPRDKRIKLLEAEKKFAEALTEDDKLHLAYYNSGVVYTMLGRHESAEKAFMMNIERDPYSLNNGASYYARAMSLFAINRQREESLKKIIESLGYKTDPEDMEYPNYSSIIKFCWEVGFDKIKALELINIAQQIKKELTGERDHVVSLLRNAGMTILSDEIFNAEEDETLYEISEVCKAIIDKDYFKSKINNLEDSDNRVINLFEDSYLLGAGKTTLFNFELLDKFINSINSILDLYPDFIKLCNEAMVRPVAAADPRHVAKTIAEKYDEIISIFEQLIQKDNKMIGFPKKEDFLNNKKIILDIKRIFDLIYDDNHLRNRARSMHNDYSKKIDDLAKRTNVIYPGFQYTKKYDDLKNLSIRNKEVFTKFKKIEKIIEGPFLARGAMVLANKISEQYEEIIKICNQLIEAKPSHAILAKAYNLKGQSLKFKRIEDADQCHMMAASNSLKMLTKTEWSGNKLDDAKKITATCLSDLASGRIRKKDSSAELLLCKAKSISKNNINIYNILSIYFYEVLLSLDDAVEELEKALTLSPMNIDCLSYLAWIYAKAHETHPNDRSWYLKYGDMEEKALNFCERTLDFFPYPSYETYFDKGKEIAGIDRSLRRLEVVYHILNKSKKEQSIKRLSERMKHIVYLEDKKAEGSKSIIALKDDLKDFENEKGEKDWWRYAQIVLCLHDLCKGYMPEEIDKIKDKYEIAIKEMEIELSNLDGSGDEREYANVVLLLGELYNHKEDSDKPKKEKIIKYFEQSIDRLEREQSQKIGHNVFWSKLSLLQRELSLCESLQSAERGVYLDPFSLRSWNHFGCVLDDMNNFDLAKIALEHGYSLYPDNAIICYNIGVIYYNHALNNRNYPKKEESLRDSIEFFNRAINLFENNRPDSKFQAHFLLGNAYHELKEYDSAILNYSIAKNLMNTDHLKFETLIISIYLADTYLMSKAFDRCEKECFDINSDINKIKNDWNYPYKKVKTSLDIGISLNQLQAYASIILALSYLERDSSPYLAERLALNVEKILIKVKDKKLMKDEKLTKDERKEYLALCRDVKGYALCKKDQFEKAITQLEFSIKMKADPRTYLHLALTYERELRRVKDKDCNRQDLIEMIKLYCRHVEELDIMRKYSEPRKELLQRLEEKSDDREKENSSKKSTVCECKL